MSDPISRAGRLRAANRRRVEGFGPLVRSSVGGLVVLALLVPLVDRLFLHWLVAPAELAAGAMQGLLLRACIVIVGWVSIDMYMALVRGGDRETLSIWPISPASVVRFEVRRMASRLAFLVPAWAVLSAPVALKYPAYWALGTVQVAGIWSLAVTASAALILGAVRLAEDERWGPMLDLVRGNNHRIQAAFLYAPGVVLAGSGVVIQLSAVGVTRLAHGDVLGAALLALPFALAPLCWLPVAALAERSWFRAGTLMAEVDARYAILEDRQEALRVYLDWSVRVLPEAVARYALKDLRHGWRERRTWIMGAWLVGLAGLVGAWTAESTGPIRGLSIGIVGAAVVGAVGVVMEGDEPEFLARWLPPGGAPKWAARVFVVTLWLQPAVVLAAVAGFLRQGAFEAAFVLGAGEGVLVVLSALAVVAARFGGLVAYGPLAGAVVTAVVVGVWT